MPLTAWESSQEAMSSCRHRLLHVIEHGIALTHDTADMYVGRRLRRRLSTAADGQKRRPIYTYVCIDCRVYIKFPRWRDEIFMHTPDVLPLCDLGIGVFSSIIFGNRNHAAAGRRRTDAQTLRLIHRPADRTTNWQTDRTQKHTRAATHTHRGAGLVLDPPKGACEEVQRHAQAEEELEDAHPRRAHVEALLQLPARARPSAPFSSSPSIREGSSVSGRINPRLVPAAASGLRV